MFAINAEKLKPIALALLFENHFIERLRLTLTIIVKAIFSENLNFYRTRLPADFGPIAQ